MNTNTELHWFDRIRVYSCPFVVNLCRSALAALAAVTTMSAAEIRPARLDDSPVPPYALPDPLICVDGSAVRDVAAWETKRRPELLELLAREVYGRTPLGSPDEVHYEVATDTRALDGRATRKQITVWFTKERSGPAMPILLYVPNAGETRRRPLFLGVPAVIKPLALARQATLRQWAEKYIKVAAAHRARYTHGKG